MTIQDDRTDEQKRTHTWLVVGTDAFIKGWRIVARGITRRMRQNGAAEFSLAAHI